MLNDLLKEISEEYGTESFIPSEDGSYSLMCDAVALRIVPTSDTEVLLYSDLCAEPEVGAGELARIVLQVNYLFKGGEGATFALDTERHHYVLQQLLTLTDSSALAGALEHFISTAERWTILIAQYDPKAKETAAGQGGASGSSTENTTSSESTDPGVGIPNTWLAV